MVLNRLLEDHQLHLVTAACRSPELILRRQQLLTQLQHVSLSVDPMLQLTIPAGVAFHHAGLTFRERDLIESGYRTGTLSILCATTTLACGVNLGASRVLFTSLKTGREWMDAATYRQCAGRAGRQGKDESGESIILAAEDQYAGRRVNWKQHEQICQRIIQQPMLPLSSCLDLESEPICGYLANSLTTNGSVGAKAAVPIYPYLCRLILDVICAELVNHVADIDFLCSHTLLHQQRSPEHVKELVRRSIDWLVSEDFISGSRDRIAPIFQLPTNAAAVDFSLHYRATLLGFATTASTLSPLDALVVHEHLSRARECLILVGGLHILFLITPMHVSFEVDYSNYIEVSVRI